MIFLFYVLENIQKQKQKFNFILIILLSWDLVLGTEQNWSRWYYLTYFIKHILIEIFFTNQTFHQISKCPSKIYDRNFLEKYR